MKLFSDAFQSLLTGKPMKNGEYPHLVTCSGDRRYPAGVSGHSCSCNPSLRQENEYQQKQLLAWREIEKSLRESLKDVEKENERLTNWVNDLQSGMYINCVYCGHRYGPSKDTPVAMADVLKAHIEKCPKHPMSALRSQLSDAYKAIRKRHVDEENARCRFCHAPIDFDKPPNGSPHKPTCIVLVAQEGK